MVKENFGLGGKGFVFVLRVSSEGKEEGWVLRCWEGKEIDFEVWEVILRGKKKLYLVLWRGVVEMWFLWILYVYILCYF